MAVKDKNVLDYGAEVKKLRQSGPRPVYILRGEEDYLRDSYLSELKKLCLPEGSEAFNYHRLQGPGLDMGALRSRFTPEELTGRLAALAGLLSEPAPVAAGALIGDFSWKKVQKSDVFLPRDWS